MNYGIAYKGINGMDFLGSPWITCGLLTVEAAKAMEQDYISKGFKNVIAFMFEKPEDEFELVSWEYANSHKIS